jgi:hypothetical protein
MKLSERLTELSSAEEFFDFFDVPYDGATLTPVRLHVMKRFGRSLHTIAAADPAAADALLYDRYRGALAAAYDAFRSGMTDDARRGLIPEADEGCCGGCRDIPAEGGPRSCAKSFVPFATSGS